MAFDCNAVAENEKYAFLLGSAIKNEDSEQFFSIYDSILPQDLPGNQLEDIKNKARLVSELPDSDFNELVLKARHFSLAPAGVTMSKQESANEYWSSFSPENTEEVGLTSVLSDRIQGATLSNSYTTSTRKINVSDSDFRRYDDDSGVCNMSKATNSMGSTSDDHDDHEGSDDECQSGSFDYVPTQIKIRSGCHLDYDEAHEIESDHSTSEIISPRSDVSEGIEMTTFSRSHGRVDDNSDEDFAIVRQTTNEQDDFHTDGGSDDDENRGTWDNRSHVTRRNKGLSLLADIDVDKNIKIPRVPSENYSRHFSFSNSASSEKVTIQKNYYKKDPEHGSDFLRDPAYGYNLLLDPPFVQGRGHLQQVGKSIDSLISPVSQKVENMPEGRKLEVIQPSNETRKKKQKKKAVGNKDVGAKTDENGNPFPDVSQIRSEWPQMRRPPSTGGQTVGNNESTTTYGSNSSSDHLKNQNHRTNAEESFTKVSKYKRLLKKEQSETKKAEEIENYKGDLSLDELINFIGGQNVPNKKSKKLVNTADDISKTHKKNKDKKQKSLSCNCIDLVELQGDSSAQPASLIVQGDNMGNTSVKTVIPVENNDIDTISKVKDDIVNLLNLQQNCTTKSTVSTLDLHSNVYNNETYKEKEFVSPKNNRDASSGLIDKNKKQLENEAKTDKLEIHCSKSVENFSAGVGIPNNVIIKPKNTKNKKTKPIVPIAKTESDSSIFYSYRETFCGPCTDDNLISDNNFIFTDIEVPHVPREDEFQVVGKKKKKTAKEICQPNNFLNSFGNHKLNRRFDDKRQISTNNISKKPSNVSKSSAVDSDLQFQDLNPSAFPALAGGRISKSFQEGRRNSTGDVPVPPGLKVQDDSDLESVKSLPMTQGSHTTESLLSPRLSYANMAAASNKQTQSGKRSSKDGGISDQDHKKAVWKGSPTERRHSIGSSPEVVNKSSLSSNTTYAATSLKTGSDENIVAADLTVKLEMTIEVNTFNACITTPSEQASSRQNVFKVNEIRSNNKVLTKGSHASLSQQDQDGHCHSVDSLCPCFVGKEAAKNGDNETEMDSSSSVCKNLSISLANSNVQSHEIGRVKSGNNGSYSKKQKSVIFLDKRVEETPENLGISFGFEMEPVVINLGHNKVLDTINSGKSENEQTNTINDVKTVNNSHPHSPENFKFLEDINDIAAIDMNPPGMSSSNASVISNSSVHNPQANSIDKVRKATTYLVKMNGIVTPQGLNASLKQKVNEDVIVHRFCKASESGEATLASVHQCIPELDNNEIYMYYGEGVTTSEKEFEGPSPTNGPTKYCGIVQYIKETDLKSNFNLAEAVVFLSKEWEKTVSLQKNEPERVKNIPE